MNTFEGLKRLRVGKVEKDILIKNLSTFRVGGKVDYVVYPKSIEKLIRLIKFLNDNSIKFKVLGNGSNTVFSDKDYNGVIVKLTELKYLSIKDTVVRVGAGYNLITLAMKVSKWGLTGLEFATGIPGTIGGAVYMNAGAYKSDMGYLVSDIKVLTPDLKVKTLYNKDLDFHYRTSFLQHNPGYICLEATIVLKRGNKKEIMELIEERRQKRLITQPLEYPSAGSVFRNPPDDFAGRLIEECGLKGYKIGGAMVSPKHANFIVNYNNATGKDVHDLILYVQEEVKKKFNIELKIEQEFVNWE
jgi:UDP-N-acetylmuramate dehydrogenase